MTTYLRVAMAVATLFLSACAATTSDMKPRTAASAPVAQNPSCLTQTGSRIAGTAANCSALGRSYSSGDIERTGSATTAEALRLLDPSITVHR